MKRKHLFPVVLLLSTLLAGCSSKLEYFDDNDVEEPSLLLDVTNIELEVGETFKINYLLFNTEDKPTFSSGNEYVASVDNEGNVLAKGVGSTIINVDLVSKHYSCEISVLAAKQYYIFLNNDDIIVEVGSTFEVYPVLMKSKDVVAEDATFTYRSYNTSIFSVSENVVNGVSVGEADLLIISNYNDVEYYKVVTVKII